MIADYLDLFHVNPSRVIDPPKTIDELSSVYFLAARIKVLPSEGYELMQDLDRVITLKPNLRPNYVTTRTENPINRGYFAYGKKINDEIVFEIYSPHPSVKSKFPPSQLSNAIGRFCMILNAEGYSLPSKAIEITASIN